jgi:hypothetical protein
MVPFARLKVRTKSGWQSVQGLLQLEEIPRTVLREYSSEIVSREVDALKISRAGYDWHEMFFAELRSFFLVQDEEPVIARHDSDLDPSIRAKRSPIKLLPALVNYIALLRV